MTGLFAVFEGVDGSGKSTQAARLAGWLERAGHQALLTREPGATPLGAALRELLLAGRVEVAPRAELLLYAADRAQHVADVIEPALRAGRVVVSDRFADSTVAYQGAGRGLPVEEVEAVARLAAGGLVPDLTVLLDLDPELAAGRLAGPGDRLEREAAAFHRRVRACFLSLAGRAPERYLVLDAAGGVEELAGRVSERVAALLGGRP